MLPGLVAVAAVPGEAGIAGIGIAPRVDENQPRRRRGGEQAAQQPQLVRAGFGVEVTGDHRRVGAVGGLPGDELGQDAGLRHAHLRPAQPVGQVGGEHGQRAARRVDAGMQRHPALLRRAAGGQRGLGLRGDRPAAEDRVAEGQPVALPGRGGPAPVHAQPLGELGGLVLPLRPPHLLQPAQVGPDLGQCRRYRLPAAAPRAHSATTGSSSGSASPVPASFRPGRLSPGQLP